MSSAGGRPLWQTTVSVGTSIVPPGPCPPPEDTPGSSSAITTPQATASIHDFAVSLRSTPGDQGHGGFDKGTLAAALIGLVGAGQKPARSAGKRTGRRPLSNPSLC